MPCCGAYMGLLCPGCAIYDTPEGRALLGIEDAAEESVTAHHETAVVAKAPRRVRKPIGPDGAA